MDNSTPPITKEALGKQTEEAFSRLSAVVSTVTAVSTLIIALASDTVSAPWLLAGATVTSAICLAVLFFSLGRGRDARAAGLFRIAAATCVVVLGFGWLYVYRDDIRFGKAFAFFSKAPAVVVDEAVARSLVSSKTGSISKDQRLMSVLDRIVEEPHSTRVLSASEPTPANSLLRVTGIATPSRSSLIMTIPDSAREVKPPSDSVRELGTVASLLAVAAGDERFFASEFDHGQLRITLASAPQEVSELVMMGYHAILGAKLYRDKAQGALNHLRRMQELRDVVTQEQVRGMPWLADALLFAARVSVEQGEVAGASKFIEDGRRLLPDDPRLRVAAAYLELRSGKPEAAAQLLKAERADGTSQALVATLRGLIALKNGDNWSAIESFDAAADDGPLEPPVLIFAMRTLVAVLAADANASPKERSQLILKHTRAAEEAIPGVPLITLLSGFGSALVGDTVPAEEAFARARRNAKASSDVEACDYWEAWAFAQSPSGIGKAIQLLDGLERRGAASPRQLGLLAELNAARLYSSSDPTRDVESNSVARAFEIAKRAIEQNKAEVRSHRVLGFYQAAQSASMKGPARREIMESAVQHFATALREGGDDARIYAQMSSLYRSLAQTSDAKRSEQRAYEVSCRCEHDEGACAIRDVKKLLEAKDPEGAKRRTNQLLRWLTDRPNISSDWGNSIVNTLALMFYQHQERGTAGELYEIIRRNVARQSSPQPAMVGLVDCNEAFIYVDAGRTWDAERLFRRGLQATTSADCEAGLAIALKQLGRDPEARDLFHLARKHDQNYGNLNVMRESYYWSDTALSLARSLSGETL